MSADVTNYIFRERLQQLEVRIYCIAEVVELKG